MDSALEGESASWVWSSIVVLTIGIAWSIWSRSRRSRWPCSTPSAAAVLRQPVHDRRVAADRAPKRLVPGRGSSRQLLDLGYIAPTAPAPRHARSASWEWTKSASGQPNA